MIRYALVCPQGHGFEAWFSDSANFDEQNASDLVECPYCGSVDIGKQIMSPAIAVGSGQKDTQPDDIARLIAKVRQHIEENYRYVGRDFTAKAMAMHNGEIAEQPLWGETTPQQTQELRDEGVQIYPLPTIFAPDPCQGKPN